MAFRFFDSKEVQIALFLHIDLNLKYLTCLKKKSIKNNIYSFLNM